MSIDLSSIQSLFALPADQLLYLLLVNFGWMPIAATMVWGAFLLWQEYRGGQYDATVQRVLLAVDIPRGNEQSVKAVENLFTYFGGAHGTFNLIEKYWECRFQLGFSFEIVSIDGYTQFLIWTPVHFRDLVESAIYSQYPDAEITEVDDYTENIPSRFPDEEWDIWGTEFIYTKKDAYPIKTYSAFGDEFGRPETNFKDPMASLMDLCSSLKNGEQLWYQMIVYPTGFDWMDERENEVRKILREKTKAKSGIFGKFFSEIFGLLSEASDQLLSSPFGWGSAAETTAEEPLKMLQLKPKEKKQVEAIQHKTSQLGFEVKNRFIYVSRKEVMNKPKVVNGFVGYMKQFMDLDLNNLRPDMERTATRASYFFVDSVINGKKNRIMSAYKSRSGTRGRTRRIMTIDELATLWHFPIEAVVKAPLIQKAPGRKAEPPMSLPVGEEVFGSTFFDEIGPPGEPLTEPAVSRRRESGSIPPKAAKPAAGERLPWDDGPVASVKPGARPPVAAVKKGQPPENLPFA